MCKLAYQWYLEIVPVSPNPDPAGIHNTKECLEKECGWAGDQVEQGLEPPS